MKKIFVMLIVVTLIAALCIPALAAKVTINGGEGRQYEAYKLLGASVSGDNYAYQIITKYETILVSALGISSPYDINTITTKLSTITHAEDMRHFTDEVYREIKALALTPDATWTWSDSENEVNLDMGYWLIADVTDLSGENEANSLVMVDTVGDSDITIHLKPSSIVTFKKVDDENDSILDPMPNNEDAVNLQDSADYDIGDHVPFAIKITMPNDIADYTYYSFIMQDKASKGLTYDQDSFKIYIDNTEFSIGTGTDKDFRIEFSGPDAAGNTMFKVYPNKNYTKNNGASVTANSTDGGDYLALFPAGTSHDDINNTTITLQYTCTLNENAVIGAEGNPNEYTLKYSNNPYDDSFGETPKDTVIVLTYKTVFNKVDHHGTALAGADFTLFKFVAKLAYLPENEAAANAAGYVHHAAAGAYGEFVEVTRKTTNAAGTEFTFSGLDDGYYKLEETVVPSGYNGIEPIEFRIEASHVVEYTSGVALTDLTGKTKYDELAFAVDLGAGSLSASIENRSGTELPSTGGFGTTMLYIVGVSLIVAAGVVLVTRKRMSLEA